MTGKKTLKTGEKILFGIFGAFILFAVIAYAVLEVVRLKMDKPLFEVKTHYDLSAQGLQGSELFRLERCTSCHRAMRNGTNMGLSLDGLGSARDRDWIYRFLTQPEQTYGVKTVDHGAAPKEASYVAQMPAEKLQAIATFLSELKSDQGSSSSPLPPEGRSPFIDNMVKMWAPKDWDERYQDVRTKGEPSATQK